MPRVAPAERRTLSQFEPLFAQIEASLGVLPNSTLTMGHRPEIMEAFARLNDAVMHQGTVANRLKQLVVLASSAAAGCTYCQAHTASVAETHGATPAEVQAVWEFETSPLFSASDRAALRVAFGAGQVPNQVTDEDMAELASHFATAEVVEIVAAIAVFGFLNRWNDTMSTQLEQSPLAFAQERLAPVGWVRDLD